MANISALVIVEFIFSGIGLLLTYLFMRSFLKKKSDVHSFLKLLAILIVFTLRVSGHLLNENIIIFSSLTIISAFILGKAFFKAKIREIGLATVFSFLVGASSELVVAFIITLYQGISFAEIIQLNIYRFQLRTLTYLIYLLAIVLVSHFRNGRMEQLSLKMTLTLFIPPLVSVLTVQQFAVHIVSETYMTTIVEIIPLVSIVVVNIFIFVFVENLLSQNEKNKTLALIEAKSDSQQQHITQLLNTHDQIKEMSHDFKHQVAVLYSLVEEEKYEDLKLNLSNILNAAHKPLIFNTENIMLDAMLSSKKWEAEKHEIDFKLKLDVQSDLSYMKMEICVLLSNALDNAIEACCRSKEDYKEIDMEIKANEAVFMFRMMNSVGESPETHEGFIRTKKQDDLHHGVGLKSMKKTCQRLGGDMEYSYDGEHFKLGVYIRFEELNGRKFSVRP